MIEPTSRAVPDATSTVVGRSLLLMIGIFTVAVVGASSVQSLANPIERNKPGAGWFALFVVVFVMAESALMTLAVVRDRRVGDTTGGLGVVVVGLVIVNVAALAILGTFSIIP